MIVRLKDYDSPEWTRAVRRFQFYDSPIKSNIRGESLTMLPGFNSMIVRLKASPRGSLGLPLLLFQFYDSPIKSFRG